MKPIVIHNETCPICAREVAHYGAHAEKNGVDLEIQGLDGEARARWGLSPEEAARRFHVEENGKLYSGLEAFQVLWARLPRYRWLAKLTALPVVRPVLAWGYENIAAPALYAMHKSSNPWKTLFIG